MLNRLIFSLLLSKDYLHFRSQIMSSPLTLWTQFFKACNLPSAVAVTYATNFVRQRIQPAMLKDLSKVELKELGVETVGDQLAILKHIKESDGVPPELSDELPSRKIVVNGWFCSL